MQEDIRQQLKSAISASEGELQQLGDARKLKRSELRQLRKALTALSGLRQKGRKAKSTLTSAGNGSASETRN